MATKKTMEEILAAKKAVGDNGHLQRKSTTKEHYIKLFIDGTNETGESPKNTNTTSEEIIVKEGEKNIEKKITDLARTKNEIYEIEIDRLCNSPKNTRKHYSKEKLEELKYSIQEQGIIEPLIIRPRKCIKAYSIDKDYEVLSGNHRLLVCKELGFKLIKCIVIDTDDVNASIIINQANIHEQLIDIEIAWGYRNTYELIKQKHGGDRKSQDFNDKSKAHGEPLISEESEEHENTAKLIAKMFGVSEATLKRKMRLTYLSETATQLYLDKRIMQDQAIKISYADMNRQDEFLSEYTKNKYSKCFDLLVDKFSQLAKETNGVCPSVLIDKTLNDIVIKTEQGKNVHKKKDNYEFKLSAAVFPEKHNLKCFERKKYIEAMVDFIVENNLQEQIYDYWQSQESKAIETPKEV